MEGGGGPESAGGPSPASVVLERSPKTAPPAASHSCPDSHAADSATAGLAPTPPVAVVDSAAPLKAPPAAPQKKSSNKCPQGGFRAGCTGNTSAVVATAPPPRLLEPAAPQEERPRPRSRAPPISSAGAQGSPELLLKRALKELAELQGADVPVVRALMAGSSEAGSSSEDYVQIARALATVSPEQKGRYQGSTVARWLDS